MLTINRLEKLDDLNNPNQHITFIYNWQTVAHIYDKTSSMTIYKWCKGIHACICARGRHFEHLMRVFTFLRSEQKSTDFCWEISLISYRLAAKVCIFTLCSCRFDWIVWIKFGLRLDIWSNVEDQTECLSSLEKYMQIRSKTGVWSELFYQITRWAINVKTVCYLIMIIN